MITIICLVGALIPAKDNTWENGATIYYPDNGAVVGHDFMVNGNVYHKNGIDQVSLVFEPSADLFPVERETITHGNKTLLTLSTFKTPITIQKSGKYKIGVAVTSNGKTSVIDTIELTVEDGVISKVFKMFSINHLAALGVLCLIFFAMIMVYSKKPTPSKRIWIYSIVSISIILSDIVLMTGILSRGAFRGSYDMFLHMCSIGGFLTPILCFMRDSKKRDDLYNLMFLWGLGGALMALLTPEMGGYAFPSFYFFQFFIKHGMIFIAVLLVSFIDGYRPKLKKLPGVMLVSTAIVGVIYVIDRLIINIPPYEPGNYMFLSYPPTGGSAIDMLVSVFGPSPYYIIGLILLAMAIYLVLWAPFAIAGRIMKARDKNK